MAQVHIIQTQSDSFSLPVTFNERTPSTDTSTTLLELTSNGNNDRWFVTVKTGVGWLVGV